MAQPDSASLAPPPELASLSQDVAKLPARPAPDAEAARINAVIEACLTRCDESAALASSVQGEAGTTAALVQDRLVANAANMEAAFKEIDTLSAVLDRLQQCVEGVQARSSTVTKAFDTAHPSGVGRFLGGMKSLWSGGKSGASTDAGSGDPARLLPPWQPLEIVSCSQEFARISAGGGGRAEEEEVAAGAGGAARGEVGAAGAAGAASRGSSGSSKDTAAAAATATYDQRPPAQ